MDFHRHPRTHSQAVLIGFLTLLAWFAPNLTRADEEFVKIRSVSPDKKFAMQIVCDGTPPDENNIDSSLIKSISLVSLPGKKVVANLLPEEDVQSTFSGMKLLWSSDAKWCAFYYAQPRIGYTSVLHLKDGKFDLVVKPIDLRIPFPKNADIRNEYISPVKWTKPGELVINQSGIFRGGSGESDRDFTAVFDPEKKKFSVAGKK